MSARYLLTGPVVPRDSDVRAVVFGGPLGNPPPDLRLLYLAGARLIEAMFLQGEISAEETAAGMAARERLLKLAEQVTS